MADLILLVFIVASLIYWWSATGVKETALAATREYCQSVNVQLLDECITLDRFWFKRDEAGNLRAWRSYAFEFASTGEDRYNGRIILLGKRVLSIQLDPYRVENDGYLS